MPRVCGSLASVLQILDTPLSLVSVANQPPAHIYPVFGQAKSAPRTDRVKTAFVSIEIADHELPCVGQLEDAEFSQFMLLGYR